MTIELCDLCNKCVHDFNKTVVTIEDHKGVDFDFWLPAKRKFKGVICDECLRLLKEKAKKNEGDYREAE